MKKLLIYVVPVVLVAAHASAAPSSGWGGMGAFDLAAGIGAGKGAPLVLVQRRGGGGGGGGGAAATSTGAASTGAISTAATFNATYRPTVTSRRTAT